MLSTPGEGRLLEADEPDRRLLAARPLTSGFGCEPVQLKVSHATLAIPADERLHNDCRAILRIRGMYQSSVLRKKRWDHFSARFPFALGAKIPYLIFSRFSFLRNTVIFLTRSYGTGLPKGNCTVPLDPLNRESSFLKASTPLAVGKNET